MFNRLSLEIDTTDDFISVCYVEFDDTVGSGLIFIWKKDSGEYKTSYNTNFTICKEFIIIIFLIINCLKKEIFKKSLDKAEFAVIVWTWTFQF